MGLKLDHHRGPICTNTNGATPLVNRALASNLNTFFRIGMVTKGFEYVLPKLSKLADGG